MTNRTFADYAASGEIELIIFNPDTDSPAHAEGQLSYDKTSKTHTSHNDIPDTTLNIGKEQRMRVVNLSGADIANGKAVRHNGVDPITGLPKIELAIANSLINARVLGVATHLIENGDEGELSTFGRASDLDTSSIPAGVPLYLSDVDPGDYVDTPPSIITQIGGLLVSDAVDGVLFVKIANIIALPALFGILEDIPDVYNLTTSYQSLVNYQVEDSVLLNTDKLNGIIEAPNNGQYRITGNIFMTVPTAIATRTVTLQVWDDTNSVELRAYAITIPRDTTEVSRSMALPVAVLGAIPIDIILRIKADVAITGVVFDSIIYDIESISIL
ncbi:MAG: hypothetical protein KAR40_13925 [Candidatus Sabulitectum sp.]|nr:hypothetical protein [Candidatus Sabulitectum sp.]